MAVDFTREQQSAFDLMQDILKSYGLAELGGDLQKIILSGITNENEITLQLQDTDSWKRRFSGNQMLRQKGLTPLSVAEYLSVERSYAQVMKNYGLPEGFYDDPTDFAKFIGNNVSASELQSRTQIFADITAREDPAVIEQLQAMGMTRGDILAYTMDPTRAMPLISKKYQTALIGAASRRSGVATTNETASRLAGMGITEQQAIQGYGQIGSELRDTQRLGDIYDDAIGQSDLESETFEGDGSVTKKRRRLASQERASFSGSSGVGQGSLTRNTSGSY